jgi:hypothetical protein
MSTIGDLTKLLEQIPIWKRINALPAQIDALAARVSSLEEELTKRPSLEQCPICGAGNMKVTSVHEHPTLGDVGIQERTLKCDNAACNHTERRIHDPMGRMGKSGIR